ncbi:MAG TPA: secretin N-terminal domain-containing protein [Burkholderiaceae bacterium]
MLRLVFASFALAALTGLAGCAAPPQKADTLDSIKNEIGKASADSRRTAQPDAVAAALLPPMKIELPKARPPLEERFSVQFNNIPAQQFFMSIVSGTRYNMLVSPEVSGTITMHLKDVTLFDVLDAARDMYGYDYVVDGTRVQIKPLTLQTRLFQINYLTGSRKSTSDIRVSSTSVGNAGTSGQGAAGGSQQNQQQGANGQQGQIDSSRISTTNTSDFWTDLKLALDAIVGKEAGRSVVVSPQSGVVVIKAMPDELRSVAQYLKATQLSVDRQVILEAKILEVQLNDNFQSGINWASFASFKGGTANRISGGLVGPGTSLQPLPADGGQPAASATGDLAAIAGYALANAATQSGAGSLFGLAFQTSNFAALLSFLESQGTVHVLSSPRIAAMNNQPAVLKIGSDEFYVTGVSTTTTAGSAGGGAVTTPSLTLQPFFSGVVLDVTPQIDDRGNITFHVHPSVSQVQTVNKAINLGNIGNYNLPLAASTTSEADTVVRGQDGHIVALGGMMREASTADRSQVPGADKLGVAGNALRNQARSTQKRELVILIKPTIVRDNTSWADDIGGANRRIQNLDPRGQR